MAVEKFLDFAWIDVLAAADDHVLDAADDVAIALLVDGREVAGMHPARGIDRLARLLLVVPIRPHDEIAAGQQLAGRAARDDAAFRIDDLHLGVRHRPADGRDPPLDRIVGCRDRARRAGFGHAVADDDLAQIHALDGSPLDFVRARDTGYYDGMLRR